MKPKPVVTACFCEYHVVAITDQVQPKTSSGSVSKKTHHFLCRLIAVGVEGQRLAWTGEKLDILHGAFAFIYSSQIAEHKCT